MMHIKAGPLKRLLSPGTRIAGVGGLTRQKYGKYGNDENFEKGMGNMGNRGRQKTGMVYEHLLSDFGRRVPASRVWEGSAGFARGGGDVSPGSN